MSVSNGSLPVWQNVSVTTSGGGSASGNVWTPKTPENYGFDLDGNQTSDGRWNYTWDAENRLIRLVANTATGPQQRLDFEYDWRGRRIGKKVWNNTAGTGTPATYLKFIYDGWNLLAELDGNNANALKRSLMWGLDLSGSEQGAGAVGGLLAIKPAGGNALFVAYDGTGNLTSSIDATAGTTTGIFEYGPFGETLRLVPNANNQSPFRFSTKYTDDESDFLYYGFRYYNPSAGRWLSRDPIGEGDGPNSYAFVRNRPVSKTDFMGLACGAPCGADATAYITKVLRDIDNTWNGWDSNQKQRACFELHDWSSTGDPLTSPAASAWAMQKVAITGFEDKENPGHFGWDFRPPARPGYGECDGTLGYGGKCYQGRDVHYIMWGYVHKLCFTVDSSEYSLTKALSYVFFWKMLHNEPNYVLGAEVFTQVGWNRGDPGSVSLENVEETGCSNRMEDNHVAEDETILWHWNPYHSTF